MTTIYIVILMYLDGQEVELAESRDRAAMHDLAERVARDPAVDLRCVAVISTAEEPTLTWSDLHSSGCDESDDERPCDLVVPACSTHLSDRAL